MHYYQHHIGDFIKSTARLTDSQVMAYLRLIWHYYDHDGIVKNDPVQISFEIGSDVELIKQIIKTFFDVDGDFLRHSRCDKEIEGYKNKSAGGKKGAESRWGNNKKDSIPMANPLPTQSEPNATSILTINHKPITNINTPNGVSDSIFKDYLEVRKTKKAKWTETALKGLQREADKAGISLEDVMRTCVERNWVGFKAEWNNLQQSNDDIRKFAK